jgi:hypothetical protein
MKYVIAEKCNCEDWKTSMVNPKPDLMPGDVVDGEEERNFYGRFLSVKSTNGRHYYIKPELAKEQRC